jgi:hypothetical protein
LDVAIKLKAGPPEAGSFIKTIGFIGSSSGDANTAVVDGKKWEDRQDPPVALRLGIRSGAVQYLEDGGARTGF